MVSAAFFCYGFEMGFKSYNEFCDILQRLTRECNKHRKSRLHKKHANMARIISSKHFHELRKLELGQKVFTYKTQTGTYFTSKPKQIGCSGYSVYHVILVIRLGGDRELF